MMTLGAPILEFSLNTITLWGSIYTQNKIFHNPLQHISTGIKSIAGLFSCPYLDVPAAGPYPPFPPETSQHRRTGGGEEAAPH